MSIPSTFAPVNAQDFTLRAVDLYKSYAFSSSAFTSTASGYFLQEAFYRRDPTPIGSSKALNDPTNSADNSYKHVIWKSIDQRYYRFPYDLYASFEHSNKNLTTKNLYQTASILTMPYLDFGIKIKPGSLTITNQSGFSCQEDGHGNLRAPYDTSSFLDRSSLVGYWGFNELFRHFTYSTGLIGDANLEYESWTHSVDQPSQLKNVQIKEGLLCQSLPAGLSATFDQSYILTPHRDEFNFLDTVDFTISTWISLPISQSQISTEVNDIITKNGVVFKTTYGMQDSQLVEGTVLTYKHYSSSFKNESTNVYPFSLQVYNQTSANSGKLLFKASNGIQTLALTSSTAIPNADSTLFHHVAVTKSGSLYSLYIDGACEASASSTLGLCANEHSLMFGAKDRLFTQALSGSLDEIRIYEYAANLAEVSSLYDDAGEYSLGIGLFQNDIIGNVFHRRGVVVTSTLLPAFASIMKDAWNINYKGTHTVYQYEALCRIRKGDFNLSMNPTARVHPKSDRLIDDFTGSLLKPYATTIGLYNDNHELMAVAKLGQPLKMRDDVDINIIVSWDS